MFIEVLKEALKCVCVCVCVYVCACMYVGMLIIIITLKFLSPTNVPLNYTYKMLKYTARLSHDCSYMFRSTWTIIREPMPNLAKVT